MRPIEVFSNFNPVFAAGSENNRRKEKKKKRKVSHPPNLNLLFSPRKTSLCFLRPEPRPPPLAVPTRPAVARAKQVNSGSFMVQTATSHHSGQVVPSGATPGPGLASTVCRRCSSASRPDLYPPPAGSLLPPPPAACFRLLHPLLHIFLSLIKIDMNLFLVAIEE